MSDLLMLEAALFQLRTALGEDAAELPIRISADVLERALRAGSAGMNTARVNDIEFAMNDLVAAIEEVNASSEARAAVALMREDVRALREAYRLPAELALSLQALQEKLKARARAMERSQYREAGTEPAPLPHPPEELREDAIPLVRQLEAEGFQTPMLDALLASPEEVRYHTLNEIVDELETIVGQ